MDWQEFLDFCAQEVEEYNRRPHSSLPKITDPQTGLRRHMCPLEMWSKWLANGWTPEVPAPEEIEALFRPHAVVTTRRGEVRLFGNIYYSGDLVHYNGEQVIVAYDIHNAEHVWIKDLDERLICIARWNANKRAFFPVSAIEQAREDRRKRRSRTLERHLEEVNAEATPAVEVAPEHIELPIEVLIGEEERRQKVISLEPSRQLRDVSNPLDVYFMILDRIKAGTSTAYQLQWVKDYEHWDRTKKSIGLYKDDPYCLKDPEEQRQSMSQ